MKIIYHHLHPGINHKLIKEYINSNTFENGIHRVVIQNTKPLQCNRMDVSILDKRVFWGYRGTRKYPSPLITQEDAEDIGIKMTTDITIVFKIQNDICRIITCYAGSEAPKEPSTALPNEIQESIEFWSNHALIPDEEIQYVKNINELPSWALKVAFESLNNKQ